MNGDTSTTAVRIAICGLAICLALASAKAASLGSDFSNLPLGSPVNCAKARFTPETTVCHDPALRQTDRQVAQAYRRLDNKLKGEDQQVFQAGQKLWAIERNDCRNLTIDHGAPGISECVHALMDKRLETLRALINNPSKLATTVANYHFVQLSYLNMFARQYAGKTVNVFGGIDPQACDKANEHSLVGRLIDKGSEFEIRFKNLTADEVEFLCAKHPARWWSGDVKFDNAHPYLFTQTL